MGDNNAKKIRNEINALYSSNQLSMGELAGGRSGNNLKYTHEKVRGDYVGWFDGKENHFDMLPVYMKRVDTLVSEMKAHVKELQSIDNRSQIMCTCYPGKGARYTRHSDNSNRNGRKLTALYYLNCEWEEKDGGKLRVWSRDLKNIRTDIEPSGDRLVLFFSDNRVPHEVLPAFKNRFAATMWYFDSNEREDAKMEQTEVDKTTEAAKIEKEINKFTKRYGDIASVKVEEAAALSEAVSKVSITSESTSSEDTSTTTTTMTINSNTNSTPKHFNSTEIKEHNNSDLDLTIESVVESNKLPKIPTSTTTTSKILLPLELTTINSVNIDFEALD
jgi:hypoxia-inducible factor (prolyl hydroxylase)